MYIVRNLRIIWTGWKPELEQNIELMCQIEGEKYREGESMRARERREREGEQRWSSLPLYLWQTCSSVIICSGHNEYKRRPLNEPVVR